MRFPFCLGPNGLILFALKPRHAMRRKAHQRVQMDRKAGLALALAKAHGLIVGFAVIASIQRLFCSEARARYCLSAKADALVQAPLRAWR
jgi:hypothetical protein